ncbi:DUF4385 domain-containing protein [Acinetobacter wanghuae]|uniref:DUF4385 domain-containing protein n=1 Tax=Acinetobacter wanghuae TaxID=2662362 RepID=UPI003AF44CE6
MNNEQELVISEQEDIAAEQTLVAAQAPAKVNPEGFSRSFDFSLDFENINFRKRPKLYRVGRGEEGVLLVEPYKSEILPLWKIDDEATATESSDKIFALFLDYLEKGDFVGADMARKFLLMGYTRSRRYAHHKKGSLKTGRKNKGATPKIKVVADTAEKPQRSPEELSKIAVSKIFKEKSAQAKANEKYVELKEKFNEMIREA